MEKKKLNIGCGCDIRKDFINLDIRSFPGIDIVHDLEKLPLPFSDNQFEEILCQDVLEHLEYIPVLKELHRILKDGGKLKIRCPHFSSANNYVDPTHKKMFSFRTFDFFKKHGSFDFGFSQIPYLKIIFPKKYYFLNYLIEPIVNISFITKKIYENTFLCNLDPAENILVVFVK